MKPSRPNQMLAKMGMSFAVLASRTMAGAVRKYRLQQVEIRPPHVEALVCHQAREMLAHRLAHDARLAVVDAETFLPQNHRDMRAKRRTDRLKSSPPEKARSSA